MTGGVGRRAGIAAICAAAVVVCAAPAPAAADSVAENTTFDVANTPNVDEDFWGQSFTVPAGADDFLHTVSLLGYNRDLASGNFNLFVIAVDGSGLPTGSVLYTSPAFTAPHNFNNPVTAYPNLAVTPGSKYAVYTQASGLATTFNRATNNPYAGGTFVFHDTAPAGWVAAPTIDLTFRAEFNTGRGVTTTTVNNCVGPLTIGVTTSCTATVTNNGPGGTIGTPTGQVTFDSLPSANAVPTGSCMLSPLVVNVSGRCDYFFTPGSGSSGSQTVNGNYSVGDATHLPDAGSTSITVNRRTSQQLGTSCVPATISLGQSATCTATVGDNDAGNLFAPAGNVTWTGGAGSFSPSASCALAPQTAGSSSCAVTYTPSALGSHAITSSYAGGTNHLGTTPAGSALTVIPPPAVVSGPTGQREAALKKCKKKRKKLGWSKKRFKKCKRAALKLPV
jgi:hypothetical protein